MGAAWLLLFEFDGLGDDFWRSASGLVPVFSLLSCQGIESAGAEVVELSPERGKRWLGQAAARKDQVLVGEFLEKLLDLLRFHLVEEHGVKEIAPEKGQFFIFLLQLLPPFCDWRQHGSSPGASCCKEGEN